MKIIECLYTVMNWCKQICNITTGITIAQITNKLNNLTKYYTYISNGATSSDINTGKIAYVNNKKIIGAKLLKTELSVLSQNSYIICNGTDMMPNTYMICFKIKFIDNKYFYVSEISQFCIQDILVFQRINKNTGLFSGDIIVRGSNYLSYGYNLFNLKRTNLEYKQYSQIKPKMKLTFASTEDNFSGTYLFVNNPDDESNSIIRLHFAYKSEGQVIFYKKTYDWEQYQITNEYGQTIQVYPLYLQCTNTGKTLILIPRKVITCKSDLINIVKSGRLTGQRRDNREEFTITALYD